MKWRDKPDAGNMASHAEATFWFVLPSLPMFLFIPAMLRNGSLPVLASLPDWLRASVWVSLAAGCVLAVALYALMVWVGPRFGLRL